MTAILKDQNIIKGKYPELIRLISLISDNIRIINSSRIRLIIKVYQRKSILLTFTLYQTSEDSKDLNIGWSIWGGDKYDGHYCFPDYFSQRNMFNTLVSRIIAWQHTIINSGIDKYLEKAQDSADKIKRLFTDDWTLLEFAKDYDSMSVGTFTNNSTGKQFKQCVFLKGNNSTFVGFHSQLGDLTSAEIIKQKENLYVGKMENGNYYLHGKDVVAWENVDL